MAPTGCLGWSVRDLVFHCLGDAQRGLVALHLPTVRAPDRDATTYWQDWTPDDPGAADGRRFPRVAASLFLHVEQLRESYLETAAAVLHVADDTNADERVATQGHVPTAGALMCTLAVEATIHHLDAVESLAEAPQPSADGLTQVRRSLDGLLGHPVQVDWGDGHYARAAAGRVSLSDTEREQLGVDAARFPLFG